MNGEALALIETHGLVPLAASIEAMCKAADVECVLIERFAGGLLVAAIRGDLGSVEQALEAGKVAAQRYGEVRSAQVYPHPDAACAALMTSSGERLRTALRSGSER